MLDVILNSFAGVPIFFCLSGYLIWNSLKKRTDARQYFKKRFVRIYPEMWLGIILSIVSIIILLENINWSMLGAFAITQGTFLQFWTPNFLREFGCGVPNGSLWTMCVLVQFYIVVLFIAQMYKKTQRRALFWSVIIGGSVTVGLCTPLIQKSLPTMVAKLYGMTLFEHFWMFAIGLFICEYHEKLLPILKRFWYIPLVMRFLITVTGVDITCGGTYGLFGSILINLACIGFAYAIPGLNIKKDISYGFYIYHMVVANIFIELGLTGNWLYLLAVIIITIVLSICSNMFEGKLLQKLKI